MFLIRRSKVLSRPCFFRSSSWKILFFGSDNTSLSALTALHKKPDLVSQLEVVTQSTHNIHTPWCLKNNVSYHSWTDDFQVPPGFDLGVVVSFGNLIPESVINSFPKKMINMHPSLLPKYRGAAPVQHALLNDDKETGVTIIDLHPTSFDQGNILAVQKVPLHPDETIDTVLPLLGKIGSELVLKVLENYEHYQENKTPQGQLSKPSRARKLVAKDGNIKWKRYTSSQVCGRHKAMPGRIYTHFRGECLQLLEIKRVNELPQLVRDIEIQRRKERGLEDNEKDETLGLEEDSEFAGSFVYQKGTKCIYVRCLSGWVGVGELQIPTRKPLLAFNFVNAWQVGKGVWRFEDLDQNPTSQQRPKSEENK